MVRDPAARELDSRRLQEIEGRLDLVRGQQAAARTKIDQRQDGLRAAQSATIERARERITLQRRAFLRTRDEIRRRLFPSGPPPFRRPRFARDVRPPFEWLKPPRPPREE